ncbi:UNVERIFIED_CONTAM: transcriptional regulator with PAS, ATPase and Fis domain [Brevibacillus sp. OAP136]
MRLQDIADTVQQIAEAVASVLHVEVEIADHHLIRVAGTGKVQPGILRTMAGEDYVYQASIRTGVPIIVEHPGFNEICKPCTHYRNCPETGEICCPILVDGVGAGVIGLLAFDRDQRERLFKDTNAIITYLRKMSELIATKLKEYQFYQEQQITLKKLTTVMDYLDKGIIIVTHQRLVVHINYRAKQYLQLEESCSDVQVEQRIKLLLDKNSLENSKNSQFTTLIESRELVVSCSPIELNGEVVEWVITLDDLTKMVEIAKQVYGLDDNDCFKSIIGNSKVITNTKDIAKRIAIGDSTILIQGESGTGKELFAQAIHIASNRKNKPFVTINCGAIPENLLESELFGYEEGAFTGAKKGGKLGKFELANGGTILLDEIGDMPIYLQVKLLRVLQEKKIERLGSSGKTKTIDVRVIAATHRDLEEFVKKGIFREDLYYRLNVIPLFVPPLRDRREDILSIANYHLLQSVDKLEKNIQGFTIEAQNMLIRYDWPGNVRELSNAVEYAVNMESSAFIQKSNLPQKILKNLHSPSDDMYRLDPELHNFELKKLEKKAISIVLKKVLDENRPKEMAAQILGISRATLFRKIKEYNIKI